VREIEKRQRDILKHLLFLEKKTLVRRGIPEKYQSKV
jgi:hypothetical protein